MPCGCFQCSCLGLILEDEFQCSTLGQFFRMNACARDANTIPVNGFHGKSIDRVAFRFNVQNAVIT